MTIDWPAAGGNPSSYVVKRVIRMDIPVDRYPNVSKLTLFVSILQQFTVLKPYLWKNFSSLKASASA